MYEIQVTKWGEPPQCLQTDNPAPPKEGEIQVSVSASCLHRLVRAKASGAHYSVANLPHTPGVDGTGVTTDGNEVYFTTYFSDKGSMVERINLPQLDVYQLPPGLDMLQAAAFMNPAMSSWMALRHRVIHLPKGFTVLILGATSASGEIAINVSRYFGAARVIGCGRRAETLSMLKLDDRVCIEDPVSQTNFSRIAQVDIVLDYIYGPITMHLFKTLGGPRMCQYVHIGAMAEPDIILKGSLLRGKNISIVGSGLGSFTQSELRAELPELLQFLALQEQKEVSTEHFSSVERAWKLEVQRRVVLTPLLASIIQ